MKLGPLEVPVPTLVLVALAVALCGAVVVAGATSSAAFTPYNPDWQGLSELRDVADEDGVETITATETERYGTVEAEGTAAFVIAPPAYTPAERARLRQFVEDGGTLVVAARDPDTANPLLATLGTNVTVDGAPLRDEEEYSYSPDFPLVTSVANHTAVRNANGLSLNYGTALAVEESSDARAIANSSSVSYLDRNGDGKLGQDEPLGSQPVIASQPVDAGEVIVVSDPSAFINAMLERDANRALAAGLLENHDRLLLDRTESSPPLLVLGLLAIRNSSLLASGLLLALVGAVVCWERGLHRRLVDRIRDRRGDVDPGVIDADPDAEALAAYLETRSPEWDDRRRDRVLGGIMGAREQRADDDRDD